MNLGNALTTFKTMIVQKSSCTSEGPTLNMRERQAIVDDVLHTDESLAESEEEVKRYFFDYNGTVECIGCNENLKKPWREIKGSTKGIEQFLEQWRDKWRELNSQMKEMHRELMVSRQQLTVKRPCYEVAHFKRVVEMKAQQLKLLKEQGEREMEALEDTCNDLVEQVKREQILQFKS